MKTLNQKKAKQDLWNCRPVNFEMNVHQAGTSIIKNLNPEL